MRHLIVAALFSALPLATVASPIPLPAGRVPVAIPSPISGPAPFVPAPRNLRIALTEADCQHHFTDASSCANAVKHRKFALIWDTPLCDKAGCLAPAGYWVALADLGNNEMERIGPAYPGFIVPDSTGVYDGSSHCFSVMATSGSSNISGSNYVKFCSKPPPPPALADVRSGRTVDLGKNLPTPAPKVSAIGASRIGNADAATLAGVQVASPGNVHFVRDGIQCPGHHPAFDCAEAIRNGHVLVWDDPDPVGLVGSAVKQPATPVLGYRVYSITAEGFMAEPKRRLVQTITDPLQTAAAFDGDITVLTGTCYLVKSYNGSFESPNTNEVCPSKSDATERSTDLPLIQKRLLTRVPYDFDCDDPVNRSQPAGADGGTSFYYGYWMWKTDYRCHRNVYRTYLEFDRSAIMGRPIDSATLTMNVLKASRWNTDQTCPAPHVFTTAATIDSGASSDAAWSTSRTLAAAPGSIGPVDLTALVRTWAAGKGNGGIELALGDEINDLETYGNCLNTVFDFHFTVKYL